jgi:hypothetical protein
LNVETMSTPEIMTQLEPATDNLEKEVEVDEKEL